MQILRYIISFIFSIFAISIFIMFCLSLKDYLTRTTYAGWEKIIQDFFAKQSFCATFITSLISWIICFTLSYMLYSQNKIISAIVLIILACCDIISSCFNKIINRNIQKLIKKQNNILLNQHLLLYETLTLLGVDVSLGLMIYALI